MKALILSGGIGSRLWPITYTRPKQLIPVANKPILFYAIESIIKAGISDIGIIVGDTGDEIMQEVGDGTRWGAKITYIYQEKPEGLAHAVKIAQPFLKEEAFLMFLGDNIIRDDLSKFIQKYYGKKLNALVVLDKVDNPQDYGVAVLENGDIVELVEKPKQYISNMAIVGLYIFDKNIFSAISKIKPSWRNELEITDAIQDMIKNGFKVSYGQLENWWKDTGAPQDMLEANQKILDDIKGYDQGWIDQKSMVQGKVIIEKDAHVINSVIRGPVIIGEKCTIKNAYIGPYTSISKGCEIENSEVEGSIIMENCKIKNVGNRINNSLIGSSTEIANDNTLSRTYSFIVGDKSKIKIL
ncbi:glucose-1-phosphate thymidylyltransferase [Petroclostridium xylanilyticum]|uniref:glucose-1-phosphate thymidylyltransferase n=1 Tax=Petroclostridium xylanilyticum TaxID=1792311 RepID=UPI000B9940AB|nr:glucose-1-phosphate thymidylyltransferase [Petroclostridium xylanilyticum]